MYLNAKYVGATIGTGIVSPVPFSLEGELTLLQEKYLHQLHEIARSVVHDENPEAHFAVGHS
jgi:hypothetical protein